MILVRRLIHKNREGGGSKENIPEPLWVVESPASRNTGGRVARERKAVKVIVKRNENLAAIV
jgi:hypothetical protein